MNRANAQFHAGFRLRRPLSPFRLTYTDPEGRTAMSPQEQQQGSTAGAPLPAERRGTSGDARQDKQEQGEATVAPSHGLVLPTASAPSPSQADDPLVALVRALAREAARADHLTGRATTD